jgi:hypothetical protein
MAACSNQLLPLEKNNMGWRLFEQNEWANGVNRVSRRIPRTARDEAFRLWLQGESYRSICAETGMSMGALCNHINELRKRTPELDELKELNVILKKGGLTVYDAIRGSRLLDRVGQLGMSLDRLESFIKLAENISSEKGVEAEGSWSQL